MHEHHCGMKRRDFLKRAGSVAAGLGLSPHLGWADAPKATEPARFTPATHHADPRGGQHQRPSHTSHQASQLAMRKQMEPRTSGVQTRRFIS